MSRHKNRSTSLARIEQKGDPNLAVVVGQSGPGQPAMMPRNMRAYLHEGMRAKTVFRVIGHIARAAAGIKWRYYQDESMEREILTSPLLDLWKNPAPRVSGTQFREAMIAYYVLTGNSYVLGINATGNPLRPFDELYNLRPDLIKIHITEDGPDSYELGTFQPPKRYDPLQIMHNKLFAGDDQVYGLSPIEVAAMSLDTQKAGQKWNLALMGNMAKPGGAWVTDATLGEQEYRGLKDEIRRKFSGPQNAGETAILHGGVKWQSMSMSPVELDWLESDAKTDRDIAGILFNYPNFLLGLADTTFNNQLEAKHYVYTDIVFPILDVFVDSLNQWFTPRYGSGYLTYDKTDVETIQQRLQEAAAAASETASAQWQIGLSTFHETRETQGKAELPGVKDFIILENVPVFVEGLNAYIQSVMDKAVAPPPPPSTAGGPDGGQRLLSQPSENTLEQGDKGAQKLLTAPLPTYVTKALNLRTVAQKSAYISGVQAQREKWYSQAQSKIAGYFADEKKTILSSLQGLESTDKADAAIQHALSSMAGSNALKSTIVYIWQETGQDSANSIAPQFKWFNAGLEYKDGPILGIDTNPQDINLYAPDVLTYLLDMAAQKVVQIDKTTLAQLQAILYKGVQAGESIIQIAKRVDALYLDNIIPNRSTVIAHTEVIAASNYGSQLAAKGSGLELNKVWLATEDSHTRPDHVEADGQIVGMDQPFIVGGSQLMFPGDNSLGAAANEIIQCRCTQYYETVEDDGKSGLPLARNEPSREMYLTFLKHLPGQHDQATHGRRRTFSGAGTGKFDEMSLHEKEAFLAKNGGTDWHTKKMTHEEKQSVVSYTGSGYHDMNGLLRGKMTEAEAGSHLVAKVKNAQSGLLKSSAPADMTVSRGYGNSQLQNFINAADGKGNAKFFQEAGFVSTTIKDKPDFSGFRVKINVFQGAPGGYVDPFSQVKGEKEFLIPPGAKFKITGYTKTPSGKYTFTAEYKGTKLKAQSPKPAKAPKAPKQVASIGELLLLELKADNKKTVVSDDNEGGEMMSDKFVGGEGLTWGVDGDGEEDNV